MQSLVMKHVDVFTTNPFGGNPAGVISEADALSSEIMLAIAGEMNLSETTFVTLPSTDEALFRIRFFTPSEEVNLSGHAIIASCYALIEDGRFFPPDMTESSRISMLGISLRKYAHFYRLLSQPALGRPECLFLLHFLVDVQFGKGMP